MLFFQLPATGYQLPATSDQRLLDILRELRYTFFRVCHSTPLMAGLFIGSDVGEKWNRLSPDSLDWWTS
jgi:hypothetical protein